MGLSRLAKLFESCLLRFNATTPTCRRSSATLGSSWVKFSTSRRPTAPQQQQLVQLQAVEQMRAQAQLHHLVIAGTRPVVAALPAQAVVAAARLLVSLCLYVASAKGWRVSSRIPSWHSEAWLVVLAA